MTHTDTLLEQALEAIEIPPSHYDRAVGRYHSLGEWLCRPESTLRDFNPSIAAQGSFRLGTVIRPLLPGEEYDLDTVCTLTLLTKQGITQQELKRRVGIELELYRQAHRIQQPLVERKRCWRLDYRDDVSFHIDVLPCVPEDHQTIVQIIAIGVPEQWAKQATALTCRTHPSYTILSNEWPTTNPGGYAGWFEHRMQLIARQRREALVRKGAFATVEQVPLYALKTPLQRAIQWYKRHRDVMFQDHPELKPISMIITTLAANSYNGEDSLYECLVAVLQRMPNYINPTRPRIPNPVNPGEDFADKWRTNTQLEENFYLWHRQALRDIDRFVDAGTPLQVQKVAADRLGISLPTEPLEKLLPSTQRVTIAAPAVHIATPPKPWGK